MTQSRVPTTCASDGIANRLLISLPKASLKRLQPALELRVTARGDAIKSADRQVEHGHDFHRQLTALAELVNLRTSPGMTCTGADALCSASLISGQL